MPESPPSLRALSVQSRALTLFRRVLEDEVGERLCQTLEFLANGESTTAQEESYAVDEFAEAAALLLDEAISLTEEPVGDLWQNHLLNRLLLDTNLLSSAAERGQGTTLNPSLREKARSELGVLQALFHCSLDQLQQALKQTCPEHAAALSEVWTGWKGVTLASVGASATQQRTHLLKSQLAGASDWVELLSELLEHYAQTGTGLFGQYKAFRWVTREGTGLLEGIPTPDPVRVDDLIGYDAEKALVIRNTSLFVHGAPGNNVLLYGDSGTGKSSMVKALLNTFADQGLRLIEVPKERLEDFPYITRLLAGRRERFIIFVDDLSFEETETEYKALKAALEGSLEARPDNVLVYATSNRRHLIREYFGDRPTPGIDEIHPGDTSQEKLSLADRFGLRVGFRATSQDQYFDIVDALAERAGLNISQKELRSSALQWAQWQNGFSGRSARQFVNDLIGAAAAGEISGVADIKRSS